MGLRGPAPKPSAIERTEGYPGKRKRNTEEPQPTELTVAEIGIGGSLTAPPLPHHRTYGSVYGGSAD